MAIDFPATPTVGQQYTYQGATYVFSAQGVWVQVAGSGVTNSLAVNIQVIAVNGTYVPSTGMQFCIVEGVASGGGGGGVVSSGGNFFAGGGGGAGAYVRSRFTATQIGVSQAIVINAAGVGGVGGNPGTIGGDCTFGGTLLIAKGGLGGTHSEIGGTGIGRGGAGGPVAGCIGQVIAGGQPGGNGFYGTGVTALQASGAGGSSFFGGGGPSVYASAAVTTGAAGLQYGSGGAGAMGANAAGNGTGGAGSTGAFVITEFIAVAIAGGGIASTSSGRPQGRLTLQTGVPVMVSSQAAKTAIFYTPYQGNQLPLYSGSAMVMTTFAELTVATTDTVSSPAAIGASKVNDWFVWDSGGGVLKLVHGPDWTSDTARSAGTALVMVNGILLNAVAITNGPPIQRGTYVGTTRSNASSQLDWILAGIAAGGLAGFLGVWNCYNRTPIQTFVGDNTDSWAYAVANTWRAANASNNMRVSFVRGLDEDEVAASYHASGTPGAGANMAAGVSLDSIVAFSGQTGITFTVTGAVPLLAAWSGFPGIGFHFISAVEFNNNATASTWYGDLGVAYVQTGMFVRAHA